MADAEAGLCRGLCGSLCVLLLVAAMCTSCRNDAAHLVEIDGWLGALTFSKDGSRLIVVYGHIRNMLFVQDTLAVYEVGTWKKLMEYRSSGRIWRAYGCADPNVILHAEDRYPDDKKSYLVLRSVSTQEQIARINADHLPGMDPNTNTFYCDQESNVMYLDAFTDKVTAVDGSTGKVLREYVSEALGDYAPFIVQRERDRLVRVDEYNSLLWVYRMSTAELLARIDLWPDDRKPPPYGVDYKLMDDNHLAFGLLGKKDDVSGAYLVKVDLAALSVEGEYYIGPYDLHGLVVMQPGDGKVCAYTHEPNAWCGQVRYLDTKTGEGDVGLDLCDDGGQFDAFAIPDVDRFTFRGSNPSGRSGAFRYLYSYPDFDYISADYYPAGYGYTQFARNLNLVVSTNASNDTFTIYDPLRPGFVDYFHICKNIYDSVLAISPAGRWAGVVCQGKEPNPIESDADHPVGAGVAVVDLAKYARNMPKCAQKAYLQCGSDGNVHWCDSCGVEGEVALECLKEHGGKCVNLSERHAACTCTGRWDPHLGCKGCKGNWDPATDCNSCKQHWFSEEGNDCRSCPDRWDRLWNCSVCRGNWQDNGDDCGVCKGNWDPLKDCSECREHRVDNGDDCGTCSSHWDVTRDCNECLPGWYGGDCQYWGCTGAAVADGSFAEPVLLPTDDWQFGLAAGDFDLDGIQDLATVSFGYLSIYKGTGNYLSNPQVLFSAPEVYQVSEKSQAVTGGDFNADGFLDLALADPVTGVSVYMGYESGFALGGSYSACEVSKALITGDFNSDGALDLAVACYGADEVAILPGMGNGLFTSGGNYPTGERPSDLVSGDFNSDGILDIATANSSSHDISVLLGNGSGANGDGSFAAPVSYANNDCSPGLLATGDFNSDGVEDIAALCYMFVSVFTGQGSGGKGDGTFIRSAEYDGPDGLRSIVVGDFNEDGIQDLAIGDSINDEILVFMGNGSGGKGDGTFLPYVRYPAGGDIFSMIAKDLNDDGILDLATANGQPGGLGILLGAGQCP